MIGKIVNELGAVLVAVTLTVGLAAAPPAAPQTADAPDRAPSAIDVVTDVVYAHASDRTGAPVELCMDVASPRNTNDQLAPAVLYFHGGGWQHGSKDDGRVVIEAFARGGYVACAVDYRLLAQGAFPAAIEDANAALRFVRGHADELGVDAERIGAWGHSAGGHLAAMLGTSGNSGIFSRAVEAPDVDATLRCVVSVSGPSNLSRTDFSDQAQEIVDAWLEAKDASEHRRLARRASPVTYLDGDDPPFLLVHGTADPLVPMNQAELFADALRRAGVAVELLAVQGGGHGIATPEAHRRVAAFFDGHLGGAAAPVIERILPETDDDAP